ncbi:MAG: hypothetical protein EOM35_03915 [Negativicutes bacterium]|nr:hypothetical protein [Negativicutes bacterium]
MVEIINAVAQLGVLVVIAGIFLYQSVVSNQKMAETLKVISESNKNISNSNENISKTLDRLTGWQEESLSIGRETLRKVDCIKIKAGYK